LSQPPKEGSSEHAGGSGPPVSVLAVDDHEIFRRAARNLIAATPGFEQVGEAASGTEALDLVADLHPDLVLIDVRMPDIGGIETARRLTRADPDVTVVLISFEEVPELPLSVASVGAAAYIRKQELSPRTLRDLWSAHGRRGDGEPDPRGPDQASP
jgi:two-component system invasion response regulator UvrY